MKKISMLLALVFVVGCSGQRRATRQIERIQKKHPALFSRDTVTVDSFAVDTLKILDTLVIDGTSIDTAVVTSLADILDSLTVENSQLKIELKTTANIETNTRTWELTGEVKNDTIIQLREVVRKQIIYKTMPAEPCTVVKGAPWWYYVLFSLGGAFFTYLGLKREGIGEVVKGFLKIK